MPIQPDSMTGGLGASDRHGPEDRAAEEALKV
jgi:hypothetical protein